MDDQPIRAALERHWSDINDQDVVHEIYHDDTVLEFPQGGERLVGLANIRAMRAVYPSALALTTQRIRGPEVCPQSGVPAPHPDAFLHPA